MPFPTSQSSTPDTQYPIPDLVPAIRRKWLATLWLIALVVAAVNLVAVTRRVRIMGARLPSPQEQSARFIARYINTALPSCRCLLLFSHRDPVAPWINYRVNYFVYPRACDLAWDELPPDALRRYDRVFAYASAQTQPASGWRVADRETQALMWVPTGQHAEDKETVSAASSVSGAGMRWQRSGRNLLGIVSVVAIVLLGGLLSGRITRAAPFADWWGNLACAHLVGATALAWLTSGVTMLTGHLLVWPVYLLIGLLLLMCGQRLDFVLAMLPTRRERAAMQGRSDARPQTALQWFVAGILLLSVFNVLYTGKTFGLEWDGYAIWQFKARAFFWDGNFDLLRHPRRFAYAHPDYPLLVSLQSWWTYAHVGRVSDRWAQVHNLLFYADLLAIFAAGARRCVPGCLAGIGTALVASLPLAIAHAASGFADMEMAAFLLALAVFLQRRQTGETGLTGLLAWLLAGIALVKNEGLLACLSGLLVLACCAPRRAADVEEGRRADEVESDRNGWRDVELCSLAVIGAHLPWFLLKRHWHLASDLLQPEHPLRFTSGLLWWRLGYTLQSLAQHLTWVGPWYPCWGLILVVFSVGAWIALRRRKGQTTSLWLLAGLQIAGYVGIYLITPASLVWHIGSSLDRLLLHVAPTLLLAALLACFGGEPQTDQALKTPV